MDEKKIRGCGRFIIYISFCYRSKRVVFFLFSKNNTHKTLWFRLLYKHHAMMMYIYNESFIYMYLSAARSNNSCFVDWNIDIVYFHPLKGILIMYSLIFRQDNRNQYQGARYQSQNGLDGEVNIYILLCYICIQYLLVNIPPFISTIFTTKTKSMCWTSLCFIFSLLQEKLSMPPWNPHFGYSKVLSQQVCTIYASSPFLYAFTIYLQHEVIPYIETLFYIIFIC